MVNTPRVRLNRNDPHPFHRRTEGSPPSSAAGASGMSFENVRQSGSVVDDEDEAARGTTQQDVESSGPGGGDDGQSDLDEELSEASLGEMGVLPPLAELLELRDDHCRVGFRCKGNTHAYEMVACGRKSVNCKQHETTRGELGRRKACGWYRLFIASRGAVRHGVMTANWTNEDIQTAYPDSDNTSLPGGSEEAATRQAMKEVADAMNDGNDSSDEESKTEAPAEEVDGPKNAREPGQVRFDERPSAPDGVDEHLWTLAMDALTSTTRANEATIASLERSTQEKGASNPVTQTTKQAKKQAKKEKAKTPEVINLVEPEPKGSRRKSKSSSQPSHSSKEKGSKRKTSPQRARQLSSGPPDDPSSHSSLESESDTASNRVGWGER